MTKACKSGWYVNPFGREVLCIESMEGAGTAQHGSLPVCSYTHLHSKADGCEQTTYQEHTLKHVDSPAILANDLESPNCAVAGDAPAT